MQFQWRRDTDDVVTVFATTSDGRAVDVADFWLQPMIDKLGMTRAAALDWQQQHAELLVTSFNRLFTSAPATDVAPDAEAWECPIQHPGCQSDCGSYGCGN